MYKYTIFIYINGVHCDDYTVIADTDEDAIKQVKRKGWFEQYYISEKVPVKEN